MTVDPRLLMSAAPNVLTTIFMTIMMITIVPMASARCGALPASVAKGGCVKIMTARAAPIWPAFEKEETASKAPFSAPSQMKHMRHSHREEIHDRQKDEHRRNHQKIIRFEVVPVHRVKMKQGSTTQIVRRLYVDMSILNLLSRNTPAPMKAKSGRISSHRI